MLRAAKLLASWLLQRHPPPEILQACADLELSGFHKRFVRLHTSACKQCREEMIFTRDAVDAFRANDVAPADILLLRERIVSSMSGVSAEQQDAINDMRRLLGTRAINHFVNGRPTAELRKELAAFVGHNAADIMLQRIPA